jgi:hypothetical protein
MGLLKNRLRTIVGEDAGFMQALSSLFVYSTNPQRAGKIARKIFTRLLHKKISYHQLLAKQVIGDAQFPEQVTFYIVTSNIGNYTYGKYNIINAAAIQQVPDDAYLIFIDETDRLDEASLQELNKTIVQHNFPGIVSFDFDYYKGKDRVEPKFNPAWSPQRLRDHNYLQNAVCIKKAVVKNIEMAGNAADTCYSILRPCTERVVSSVHITRVMLSKQWVKEEEEEEELFGIVESSQPLVSIIIPTFNKSHLVKQCIRLHHKHFAVYQL